MTSVPARVSAACVAAAVAVHRPASQVSPEPHSSSARHSDTAADSTRSVDTQRPPLRHSASAATHCESTLQGACTHRPR